MAKAEQAELPSAFSLLRPSVDAIKLNIWTFVALWLFSLIASMVGNLGEESLSGTNFFFGIIGFVVTLIISSILQVLYLRSAQNKQRELDETVRESRPFLVRLILLQILTAIFIICGFILLIIPGLFAIQRLLLAPYFLVDKNMGIIDSMKASAEAGKQYSGAMWGLLGVMLVYTLLIFTIILIPLSFVLLLIYSVAPAIRYLQIQNATK